MCRAAVSGMSQVTVRVIGVAREWFTLVLSRDTTIWQLKQLVRAVRSIPCQIQRMLVGEKVAAAG